MGKLFFNRLKKSHPHYRRQPKYPMDISSAALKNIFSDCSDFSIRQISTGGNSKSPVSVCWLDGVVNGTLLSDAIIRPLTDSQRLDGDLSPKKCMDAIMAGAVYCSNASEKKTMDELVEAVVKGFSVVIFDREHAAIAFETRSSVQRSISEPTTEKSVKGPKDAFIEQIRTNTMLIRRRLCTPDLKIRRSIVGRRSSTECAVVYIDGISDPEIVDTMCKRLDAIDIDAAVSTANIEEYISDSPFALFPLLLHTERPDRFVTNLLEGRVGLLVDGLPMGFLAPATLPEVMCVPDDRSLHWMVASFLRILRYLAAAISILLPAIYVAVAMYHQEMIPIKLLLSIIQSKQQVPFSTALEILSMLIAFELLQEAGLRLPDPVGQTVSIIGALIVGQSAVEAKVVSPIAVIVVAIAGITGYTVPGQDLSSALRLCRFGLVLCSLLAGLYGVIAGLVLIVFRLCTIESFGVSYLSPLADGGPFGIFRVMLRRPLPETKLRPEDSHTVDKRNQA